MAVTSKGMVVTCQPLAADIGVNILRKGGNAADAFVATTLAEYVTAQGYTSLSGPLNLLYYEAKTRRSIYLNAGFNKVSDPKAQFDVKNPIGGRSFVIGGAGRGLESLFQRYGSGRLGFKEVVKPSVDLAIQGFKLDDLYAWAIKTRSPLFKSSQAWNALYNKNGKLLAAGDTLIQTDLANTLTHFGNEGADYLFKGQFAQDLVTVIASHGGNLTLQDLANYQVYWAPPLQTTYHDYVVQSGSYRSEGGLFLLLALKAIENFPDLGKQKHFSQDEVVFEKVLRTFLFSLRTALPHFYLFAKRLDDLSSQEALLNGTSANDLSPQQIWNAATNPNQPAPWTGARGNHSCDTLVVDREGNIVAGNHTISSLEWGDYGLLADGVSLNSAYVTTTDSPAGERAIDTLIPVLIFKDKKPWAAAGFFDSSLQASAFEVLLNLMDYGMNPNDAIFAPRFGTTMRYTPLTIPLDPRFPQSWVADFIPKGIHLDQPKKPDGTVNQKAYVDTGDAMVIRIDQKTGLRYGSPSEVLSSAVAEAE